MRRRAPDEKVRDYRERTTRPEGDALRDLLAKWAEDAASRVGEPWPDLPPGVADRAADVWEPLVMVADLAGGDWPKLAREACTAFVMGARDDTASAGTRLLDDLRGVFGDAEELPTQAILDQLHALDESPWGEWYGHPLTARELAKLLKPYGATPRVIRVGDATPRGYRRADLHDAWKRYGGSATDATSETPLASTVASVASVADTPQACSVCNLPLDPGLAARGDTTHPTCDPAP